MDTNAIAQQLVSLCRAGKFHEAISTLYADDVVSVEAMAPPGGSREMTGIQAVLGKGEWWTANHEVHSAVIEGPLVAGAHFAVTFIFDITQKQSGQRMLMQEIGVYQVASGKIVREEFFYAM